MKKQHGAFSRVRLNRRTIPVWFTATCEAKGCKRCAEYACDYRNWRAYACRLHAHARAVNTMIAMMAKNGAMPPMNRAGGAA